MKKCSSVKTLLEVGIVVVKFCQKMKWRLTLKNLHAAFATAFEVFDYIVKNRRGKQKQQINILTKFKNYFFCIFFSEKKSRFFCFKSPKTSIFFRSGHLFDIKWPKEAYNNKCICSGENKNIDCHIKEHIKDRESAWKKVIKTLIF